MRYQSFRIQWLIRLIVLRSKSLAEEKKEVYKAVYQGSGTFVISKPKRKSEKIHQSRLKASSPRIPQV